MRDVSSRRRIDDGRRGQCLRALLLVVTVGGGAAQLEAAIDVSLVASPPSPAPVGTMIAWTAQVFQSGSGDLWYRFRARELGGSLRMIRDYGPSKTLDWTSIDEGAYEIELSVRDRGSLEVATTRSTFQLESRVRGDQAVVSPTSHPLVFLYSSPGCEGGRARVQFQSAKSSVQYTPYKPCVPAQSLNFYLAGLVPNASYSASLTVDLDSTVGQAVTFETGDVPPDLTLPSVVQAPATPGPQAILLQAPLYQPAIATDMNGNLLWFGPSDLSYLTQPGAGGTFFGILSSGVDPAYDVVRRFDLVGMTLQETNVARVNEQLAVLGKRPISGFHHDAGALADGKMVVLGDVEQILMDVQGPGSVDVIGDMILVLDANLQVAWSWDTFDHLDTSRRAVLGETCLAYVGCAPYYLSADANDWTHGNSVEGTPDGDLLYSSRHQDWLIKIDYQDGAGNGDVIWRLGKDGDFTYDSTDPYPWFSHQHDAAYEPGSLTTITLFDNGNTRVSADARGASRGQAIQLDEKRRVAHLVLNADLGVFSSALGSAQKLEDGTYQFDAGFVYEPSGAFNSEGLSIQVDAAGKVISSVKLLAPVYRSFRVGDLYGPADAPARFGTRSVEFRK
jgi:arylsulfate sulfotransferase